MAHTLVLLRHGESTWNQENLFTGWHDVPLTDKGEARRPSRAGPWPRRACGSTRAHTSLLTRAVDTANLALAELGQPWLPVRRSWRLNERHYGDLQGKNKRQTAEQYGAEQTHLWRRSYDVPAARGVARQPRAPGQRSSLPLAGARRAAGVGVPEGRGRPGCSPTGTTPSSPSSAPA